MSAAAPTVAESRPWMLNTAIFALVVIGSTPGSTRLASRQRNDLPPTVGIPA
jgi:hypothetical protein